MQGKITSLSQGQVALQEGQKSIEATLKALVVQVSQLAKSMQERPPGRLPSDTEVNPRDQCHVVTTRSGLTTKSTEMPRGEPD